MFVQNVLLNYLCLEPIVGGVNERRRIKGLCGSGARPYREGWKLVGSGSFCNFNLKCFLNTPVVVTSYFGNMPKRKVIASAAEPAAVISSVTRGATGFDSRLISEFDGEKTGVDVVEWFTRAEVLCKHNGVDLAAVLPARLTGGAFAVWLQIPEEKRCTVVAVRDALYDAFAMDPLAAYDAYASRRLQPGESVDVYLADLRRLATLYGGVPDRALACAFIAGLPDNVRSTIRAGTRAEALDLPSIIARTRAVLSDERVSWAAGAAREEASKEVQRKLAVRQAKRPPPRCWSCGKIGHIARTCPNAKETASARAPSPNQ